MAFRCAVVMRGGKKPCVVLEASKMADGSGVAPAVLIPTPWAKTMGVSSSLAMKIVDRRKIVLFILLLFGWRCGLKVKKGRFFAFFELNVYSSKEGLSFSNAFLKNKINPF